MSQRTTRTVITSTDQFTPVPTAVTHFTSAGRRPDEHAMHAVERPFDVWILFSVLMLLGLGSVMVYSASIGVADMRFDDPNRFLRTHSLHLAISLGAFVVGMTLNYQVYRRYVYHILGFSVALMVLVVAGLGETRHFSTRWLKIGPVDFQPSELAKLAFVIYLAYSLEKKLEDMRTLAIGFLPHLLVCVILIFLCLLQPDLGTCLLLGSVLFGMLFIGGTKITYIVGVSLVAVPMVVGYIARSSNRVGRIMSWLDPWADRLNTGYQTVNALVSLGSGGLTGLGLGNGRQKMGFLTQGWTDFVFASIGEELGLIGCACVVLLFLMLCWRGFRAAWRAPDRFGRYMAFGIVTLIGIQAAFNMGVAVGLLPTKGLNLPFVSGGGSSLLVSCFGAGILINISRFAEQPSTWQPLDPTRRKTRAKKRKKSAHRKPRSKTRRPLQQNPKTLGQNTGGVK
ncbi:MAG: putative lipid II flippase FtsW [Myxococcota bacterium]|nr:putative lipid II flippase FtsW [Myxococcota bacterium]